MCENGWGARPCMGREASRGHIRGWAQSLERPHPRLGTKPREATCTHATPPVVHPPACMHAAHEPSSARAQQRTSPAAHEPSNARAQQRTSPAAERCP
eukprot:364392-Chlamydomonas_euryale.AAC.3